MKPIADRTGRFAYRPFYEDGELDDLCESAITSYISDHSGSLILPIPTDRLITLIERDAAELDTYADLSMEGDNVQGLTLFKPGEKPVVLIDEKLSSKGREHRLRTTLAHEWGHVVFHDLPFQTKVATGDLFARPDTSVAKCKRDDIVGAKQTDWIEWQAGYVCGALLMPKTHVRAAANRFCDRYHAHGRIVAGTGWVDELAEHVSHDFQVSKDAARVRINQVGLVRKNSADLALKKN